MASRARDWLEQAEGDIAHARTATGAGSHEWSRFAAQQAAEKALKAVVLALLHALPKDAPYPRELEADARALDKLYIPTRYPNGFDQGKPADHFRREDADDAIARAEAVLDFCRRQVPRP